MFIQAEHFLWLSIILIVIELFGIIAAAHALFTVRTSQGAVAWAVSLVFMPILTLIPYLVFGRNKFGAYIKARRLVDAEMHQVTNRIDWRNWIKEVITGSSDERYESVRAFYKLTGMPLLANNKVNLLINGKETFDAIFTALRNAKKVVLMEFFIVNDDALGKELQQELIACAERGIKVYFLYDRVGSIRLPGRYIAKLKKAGVYVSCFSTRVSFLNRFQWNFRCHRKITIVDGEIAFVGGHNVGVEYLGKKPPLAPWRDTHIKLLGPIVTCLQETFAEDWFWADRTLPELLFQTDFPTQEVACQSIPSGPADEYETCSLFFVEALNAAKERIWIATPYFVPDEAVWSALQLAVLRGVDVRILMPSRKDHLFVYLASVLYGMEAVRLGAKVFTYSEGFTHQKVVLIDRDVAAVGSANMDNRSFRLNFEIMVLAISESFNKEVEEMLASDFAASTLKSLVDAKKYSFFYRFGLGIARLLSPVL